MDAHRAILPTTVVADGTVMVAMPGDVVIYDEDRSTVWRYEHGDYRDLRSGKVYTYEFVERMLRWCYIRRKREEQENKEVFQKVLAGLKASPAGDDNLPKRKE